MPHSGVNKSGYVVRYRSHKCLLKPRIPHICKTLSAIIWKVAKSIKAKAEADAKLSEARKIVLDVESDNSIALRLYKKLGYEIIDEFTVHLNEGAPLRFYRCAKSLDRNHLSIRACF